MFIHFVSRQGRNLLVNIKDISFVLQKGVFCELHIRGSEGYVMGKRKLTAVCSHQTRIGNLDAHLI
ncbi:hypothetical protein WDK40_25050 [Escherichia coli]